MKFQIKLPILLLLLLSGIGCTAGLIETTEEDQPTCSQDSDCGNQQVCSNGQCKPSSNQKACSQNSDCGNQKVCSNGQCKPDYHQKACSQNSDCGDQLVCSNGKCEYECSLSTDCSGNKVCFLNQCIEKNTICKNFQIKCPENYNCLDGRCVPTCSIEERCGGACCNSSETCFKNQCVEPPKGEPQVNPGDPQPVLCATSKTDNTPRWCKIGESCFDGHKCVKLGHSCDETNEEYCRTTEFCDPTYKKCIKYTDEHKPTCVAEKANDLGWGSGNDSITEILHWDGTKGPLHEYDQVMATPVVANVLKDEKGLDTPEIIFTSFGLEGVNREINYASPGVLRVISSKTTGGNINDVTEHWNSVSLSGSNKKPFWAFGATTPAVADIDNDGSLEIIVEGFKSKESTERYLYAVKGDGTFVWRSRIDTKSSYKGPIITDLDGDGTVEIISNGQVFDNKGKELCALKIKDAYVKVSNVVDIDNDGKLEILAGIGVFSFDKSSNKKNKCELYGELPANTYFSAIADMTGDKKPNIITAHEGNLYLLTVSKLDPFTVKPSFKIELPTDKAKAKKKWESEHLLVDGTCKDNSKNDNRYCMPRGGTPTIADFDGDGKPDIGIATRWFYLVYNSEGKLMWEAETNDASSGTTSSSVFDFNGDGKAEVVYNDEEFLYIFSGEGTNQKKGNPLVKVPNITYTIVEYPVVADVNLDGHANIVVSANNYNAYSTDNRQGKTGIRIFAHKHNKWVSTRSIWNQFAYNVTNIKDDGTIPNPIRNNWELPWLNNYLQNTQTGNPNLLPNAKPVIRAVASDESCTSESAQRTIVFDIENTGSARIYPDTLSYTVHAVDPKTNQTIQIATGKNKKPINPNQSEQTKINWNIPNAWKKRTVHIVVSLNDDVDEKIAECNTNDNTATVEDVPPALPELDININTIATNACPTSKKMTISFEISNNSSTPVTGKILKVDFYLGVNEGNLEHVKTAEVNEDISNNKPYAGTIEIDVPESLTNQSLFLRAILDKDDEILECSKLNNQIDVQNEISCPYFNLG